jgi:hypothetical protein
LCWGCCSPERCCSRTCVSRGLATLRAGIDTALTPVYLIAGIPSALDAWQDRTLRSRSRLLDDNDRLRRENLVLQGRRSSSPRYRRRIRACARS